MSSKKGNDRHHPSRRSGKAGWRDTALPQRRTDTAVSQQPSGLTITNKVNVANGLGTAASLTANVGTSFANDLLIAVVTTYNFAGGGGSGAIITSTVTDSAGLTWHLRSRTNGINGTSFSLNQEVWWALAATPVGTAVTATFAAQPSQATSLSVFAVSGSPKPSAPWDTNAGLPALQSHMTGFNAAMSQSGVTSSTKAMLFAFVSYANNGHGNSTDPTGFTAIEDVFGGSLSVMQDFKQLTVAGPNTPAWGVNQDDFQISIDALTGDAPNNTTGTITTNLTKASQSLVGSSVPNITGTITTNLTKASFSAAGWAEAIGSVTTNLSKMTIAAAAATEIFTGTIVTRLTKANFAAAGAESFIGTVTTRLSQPSEAAAGWTTVSGSAATHLLGIAQSASGHEGVEIDGTIVTTLTKASFAAAALEIITGTAVTALDPHGISISGTVLEIMTGTIVTRLGNENGQMVGNVVVAEEIIQGPIVMALPPFRPLILGAKLGTPGIGKWYSWRYTDS